MKLRFTNDWLRNQIEKDADIECDVGIVACNPKAIKKFLEEHQAYMDEWLRKNEISWF